jgi:hypothetical protein
MDETQPTDTDKKVIIDIVENARKDMSGLVTLEPEILERYIEIKSEDARAEDQAMINQLILDLKTAKRELAITQRGYAQKVKEVNIVKEQGESTLKLVVETLTESLAKQLGSATTSQFIEPIKAENL